MPVWAARFAIGDDLAAVGIPGDDYGVGSGAIFEEEDGSWRLAQTVSAPARAPRRRVRR